MALEFMTKQKKNQQRIETSNDFYFEFVFHQSVVAISCDLTSLLKLFKRISIDMFAQTPSELLIFIVFL